MHIGFYRPLLQGAEQELQQIPDKDRETRLVWVLQYYRSAYADFTIDCVTTCLCCSILPVHCSAVLHELWLILFLLFFLNCSFSPVGRPKSAVSASPCESSKLREPDRGPSR